MRIIDNIRKFAVNAAVHGFISRRTWVRLRDRTGLKEDVRGLVQLIEDDKSGDDARLLEVVFQGLRCALAKEGYTCHKPNASVSSSGDEPEYAPRECSVISLRLQGGDTLHDIDSETYHKLKASGLLWELYPDAPDVFPSQNTQ